MSIGIHNELRHYVAELEVLADIVRQHIEMPAELQARPFAIQQLSRQLDAIAKARRDFAEEAARV
jgi:RNAse (barnase) inhibitor barstar